MCGGSERLKHKLALTSSIPLSSDNISPTDIDMDNLTVETADKFPSLLELAANNDIDCFKRVVERDPSGTDEVGLWYGRKKGSNLMVLDHRTPLMVAATYGSIDIVKFILWSSNVDVNRSCGLDKSTALHCAASSGSINTIDVVKILLEAGADRNLFDANGQRPVDVILLSPNCQHMKFSLQELLTTSIYSPVSPCPENKSPSLCCDSTFSPKSSGFIDVSVLEKKDYPMYPSFPDIKNGIYSTDEFRMFSFKVRPCSRAYSHDWTECPFVHPGENARRRDPRKYHYSCVPCPDFRKGACRRGDMCEQAHGVFECWLHPAQYRTRLCKDGTSCNRRVCFFAHKEEELRPLNVSTGLAVPSPRSRSNSIDFASVMSPSPGSPSSNGISNMGWPQLNVPGLHLQSSRLRSSLNEGDIAAPNFELLPDFDVQQQNRTIFVAPPLPHSLNWCARSNFPSPSNLKELFSSERSSSPRYSYPSHQASIPSIFSPTHKSAVLNQFPQSMASSMSTNLSPKTIDHPLFHPTSPIRSQVLMLAQRERQQQQLRNLSSHDLSSNSSTILGSPGDSFSKWGPSNGKPDWIVSSTDEFSKLHRSSSFELGNNGEEPDLSWVQSLVKEAPQGMKEQPGVTVPRVITNGAEISSEASNSNSQIEEIDHTFLGTLIEQIQLDQLTAL